MFLGRTAVNCCMHTESVLCIDAYSIHTAVHTWVEHNTAVNAGNDHKVA